MSFAPSFSRGGTSQSGALKLRRLLEQPENKIPKLKRTVMLSISLEPIDQHEVAELLRRSDERSLSVYPTEDRRGPTMATLIEHGVRFFVARLDGAAVGCGGYISNENGEAELKRMFVDAGARGHGIGRAILDTIEQRAKSEGIRKIRLETGILSVEARRLYARSGYKTCGPFGNYLPDPQSVFMEKDLV